MMSYNIAFSKSVIKTILQFGRPIRDRIYKALNNLPVGDIKRYKDKIIHLILD